MEARETVKTSIKYKPLYDLLQVEEALNNEHLLTKDQKEYYTKLSKVDTVIVTGGRGSAKSFEASDWNLEGTLHYNFKTLYTRFTNVSMSDSVIPEVKEKIELNNLQNYFTWSGTHCHCKIGTGQISFKGIKAGSSGQTANLKSLKGFNCQITEEAEEIPDFKTFEKVYYSIRSVDKQNLSILILNPTTRDHWIYTHFFEGYGVQGGFNGIKENVLYIHTSYLDVDRQYIPKNIVSSYERMKVKNPNDYNHIVMGGWITDLEGAVYKRSDLDTFSLKDFNYDNVDHKIAFLDPADRGTDSTSMPIGYVVGQMIYIVDWYFSTDNQDITIPQIAYESQHKNIEHLAAETNGLGLKYFEELQNHLGCISYPISQQTNKHSRIIQNSGFIRNYFVFRDDYEAGSMYDKAMRELFAYNKDEKINRKNTNFNDDSPDSLTGIWLFANDLFDNWSYR